MTPRQRVLEAINHIEPDRVPIDFWATDDVYDRLADWWAPCLYAKRSAACSHVYALRFATGEGMAPGGSTGNVAPAVFAERCIPSAVAALQPSECIGKT